MKRCKFLGSTSTEKFIIKGINVYKYNWLLDGNCVIVIDPTNQKPRSLSAYKILVGEKEYKFVSGILSNGQKGFFEYE